VKTGHLWPFCERFPERFLQNRVEIAAFSRDGRLFQSIPNLVASARNFFVMSEISKEYLIQLGKWGSSRLKTAEKLMTPAL
jgi:hypothetical protein